MATPARIRVNTAFPFPSLVNGSGPVMISKASGIWTVGFSIDAFQDMTPLTADFPGDYFLVYDRVRKTFFKLSLANLQSVLNVVAGGLARAQRAVTASPIVITSTDQILNCNIASAATCILPSAASRIGVALTFKDLGQATAHNITITPAGGDTIDGLSTIKLTNNFQTLTLVPLNDGTNTGWVVE
jgi:hypothetical protein